MFVSSLVPVVSAGEGSFLVQPGVGLMIWTLLAFGITLLILRKYAFPRIADALEKRRRAIEDSINAAERTRQEADELLSDYRKRLAEAREQAEDIVSRAHKAADNIEQESRQEASQTREKMLEDARKEIELETQRAIAEIRKEVADLTVMATEKVARKSLDDADHKRLVEEALAEVDFSQLVGTTSNHEGSH
jgi:F-type H+-transporting ATPase subunit b